MNSNAKIYEKPIHGVTQSGSKHYFAGGVEVTRQEYTKACLDYKRKDILFLIESDFSLPASYQSRLSAFFKQAPDHDLQGSAAVAYGRYKRAFLFFLDFQD